MDGVLERIEEDDDQEASDEDEMGVRAKKSSSTKKLDEEGRASTGKLQTEKVNSEPFELSAGSPQQQKQTVDLGTEEDDAQEESKGQAENKPLATSGSLELKIIEADLERNLDSFGNQDPFAIFELDGQKFQTKTIDGGGKKPVWNEETTFKVANTASQMSVTIYDEDNFSNDLNCQGTIALLKICVPGGTDEWHELQHEGKTVGRIHLVSVWTGDA